MALKAQQNIGPGASHPAAAAVVWDVNDLIGLDTAGNAGRLDADGTYKTFAGIATMSGDNTDGAAADLMVHVIRSPFVLSTTLTGSSKTLALHQATVYATDHETLTLEGGVAIGSLVQHQEDGKSLIHCDVWGGSTQAGVYTIAQQFVIGDFTDGGGAEGTLNLDDPIPAGSLILGSQVEITTITGGSSQTMDVGVDGDDDAFAAALDISAAATVGAVGTVATSYVAADDVLMITAADGADFGNITVLTGTVRIAVLGSLQF